MRESYKLLNNSGINPVAIYKGRKVYTDEFLFHVKTIKDSMKGEGYAINLCDNRYHFLVAFCACVSLNKISLFPNSKTHKEIERLSYLYPGSSSIDDEFIEGKCKYINTQDDKDKTIDNFDISSHQVVSILFTSGTTGDSKENLKTWGQLNESALRVAERFKFDNFSIVAAVPPQHMFGFETSIIYPLTLGVTMHDGLPFYPLDIQSELSSTSCPKILIATPLHLKACIGVENNWKNIELVISATSPLSKGVSKKAEEIFNAKVYEIYGCSEAGAIATRRASTDDSWSLLNDYTLSVKNGQTILNAIGFDNQVIVPDMVEIIDNNKFNLLGRDSDLIKVGGKRESLVNISRIAKSIDGVEDAVFFMPDEDKSKRSRLVSVMVSNNKSIEKINKELSKYIDSVFLPRTIVFVNKLPYNNIGKLKLSDLTYIVNQSKLKK